MASDFYHDTNLQEQGIPNGFCYYMLYGSQLRMDGRAKRMSVPPLDSIVSVSHCPYLDFETNTDLLMTTFDYNRFVGKGQVETEVSKYFENLTLARIVGLSNNIRTIRTRNPYYTPGKTPGAGKKRSWKNEGKVYQFPFSYNMLYDGLGAPYEFKPHLCPNPDTDSMSIKVKTYITPNGTYRIYIDQYKNDISGGHIENMTNLQSTQIPTISNAYINFMSQNKSQMATQRSIMRGQSITSLLSTGAGIAMMATGNPAGVGTAIAGGVGLATGIKQQRQLLAEERDLAETPNGVGNAGSDGLFDLQAGLGALYLYRMRQTDEYMEKIGDYFAMYGYAQNKMMKPNLRSRYFYNFVKTAGANLKASGIPREHLNVIKNIFDNGTTIIHADRKGVDMGTLYEMDNYEI